MEMAESHFQKTQEHKGETYTYQVHRLDPTSPDLAFLAGKYSALSLRALMTDPGSFGVAYKTEAAYSPAQVMRRISRPNVHIFICVAYSSELPVEESRIENGAWVGMTTQIGPTPKETFWLKETGAPEPLEDQLETHWHITATWIDPDHRGRGLAQKVTEAAVLLAAASITGTVQQARLRLFIAPGNEPSTKLYAKAGFKDAGHCNAVEAMAANGNADCAFRGRTDWDEEFLHARVGGVMERVVKMG